MKANISTQTKINEYTVQYVHCAQQNGENHNSLIHLAIIVDLRQEKSSRCWYTNLREMFIC